MTIGFLTAIQDLPDWRALVQKVNDFKDAPHDSADYLAMVIVLLLLWLLLRRRDSRKEGDLKRTAADVLEDRFKSGELSKEAYNRARADLNVRHKGR
jgi:hypothetical protein